MPDKLVYSFGKPAERGRFTYSTAREAIYIIKWFLSKKKRNEQPENARIAHRAVKFAKLAETYNVSLSDEDTAKLAGRIAEIPDRELDEINAGASPIIGCPVNIIPLFAGYSRSCAACPYYVREHMGNKYNCCALKET